MFITGTGPMIFSNPYTLYVGDIPMFKQLSNPETFTHSQVLIVFVPGCKDASIETSKMVNIFIRVQISNHLKTKNSKADKNDFSFSGGEKKCFQIPSSLTHYQTKNFRLLQTEKVCRRQFQI